MIVTLITYCQVLSFGFLDYDTQVYVTSNRIVLSGLSLANIKWAFLTTFFSNWHPFTWLSWMLDMNIWGLHAGGFHATNLILHILNSILIFILFDKMTHKTWESAILAALFALHPMHIESVAWIAERKDVLSTFFFLLSILGYFYYVRVQGLFHYFLVLIAFSFALMSKPMVVTLPFILLLLDFWPLGRIKSTQAAENQGSRISNNIIVSVFLEKIPLVMLTAICCWLTILAQHSIITNLKTLPLSLRFADSVANYLDYIRFTLMPVKLSVLYPSTGMPPLLKVVVATGIIFAITFLGIKWRKDRPWLLVGWLWYLGTLVPVIGIVQVGNQQSIADRYSYIPHIGLFIVIVWGASTMAYQFKLKKKLTASLVTVSLLFCSAMTIYQLRFWKNDGTLFARAVEISHSNYLAESYLGHWLLKNNKLKEAESHLTKSIWLKPANYLAYADLGELYALEGKSRKSIEDFRMSLRIDPFAFETNFFSHFHLANELTKIGSFNQAYYHYKKAIQLAPDNSDVWFNTGELLIKMHEMDNALLCFKRVLSIDANNSAAKKEIITIADTKKSAFNK